MSKLQLLDLAVRNFKGIRDFHLKADGYNAKVYGENGVGKTTLFDAFTWAMFDKDSKNKKDFEIKTLDAKGNALHNLEHEVTVVLLVDGVRREIRKVFTEKWTKKRGSAEQEFSGHTTDYYLDGVPVKAKEYKEFVDTLISEDLFKLLTNPAYFNEHLKWQDRRKTLIEICGDVTDAEVIEGNKALEKLPAILGNRTIDDHRKVIAARRTELNKELEKIPVRIDEVHRSIPDTDGLSETDIENAITAKRSLLEEKQAELTRINSGAEVTVKENRYREIQGELLQVKNQLQAGVMEKIADQRNYLSSLRNEASKIESEISGKERQIQSNKSYIGTEQEKLQRMRQEWSESDAEEFAGHTHDENCPTCGQSLPAEQVAAAHEKALAAFNKRKSERLESITARGKAAAAEVSQLEQVNAKLETALLSLRGELETYQANIKASEEKLRTLQAITDPETNPLYIEKLQDAQQVKQEIEDLRISATSAVLVVKDEIAKIRYQADELEQEKAKFAQARAAQDRIAELEKQEKALAAEYEKLEKELYLTEEFIRTKVALLESKINSKFKLARFKLFEQQINGGVSECCVTLYNGVPYGSGLNNAAEKNVGLDIITTLSEFYGFTAPIFIDNAESVTRLIDTPGQQICLVVSEADKKLRVELQQSIQEAI